MDNQNIKQYKFIELEGVKLFVMRTGLIYRYYRNHHWKFMENINNGNGYNRLGLNKKKKLARHRIICYAFKNLDINNQNLQVDHIDGNRLNNNIDNLRIVNHQQNQWNRTKAKGYYWDNQSKKWKSQITLNNKVKGLGLYTTEEEAHQAYLNAKLIYHKI